MQRRNFIHQMTALGSLTLTGIPQFSYAKDSKYKMGLQLFTVRDAMAINPIGTLQKVKEMGYEDFETYGFDPEVMYYRIGVKANGLNTGEQTTVRIGREDKDRH